MKGLRTATVSVLLLALTGSFAAAATLEEVESKLAEKMSKRKSVQYKAKVTSDNKIGEKDRLKTSSNSTFELKRKGEDRYAMRTESKSTMTRTEEGKEVKEDSNTTIVWDGDFMYTLTEASGQKMATKMKLPPDQNTNPFDGKKNFAELHKHFDVKLVGEEKVDGKNCWVIETKLKPNQVAAAQMQNGRNVSYYDQDSGLVIKSIGYDGDEKVMEMTISDIRIDADIPDDRFALKIPEGVQLVDMTQQQEQPAAGDTQAQSNEEPKQEQQQTQAQPKEEPKPVAQQPTEQKKEEKKGIGGLLKKLK